MSRFVGLLRGINVGRHVRIGMPELRAMVAELGCTAPHTVLQSGNLIFGDATHSSDDLELLLEAQIERRFGQRVDCFVRSSMQWEAVVTHNPFVREAEREPAHVVAMMLKDPPAAMYREALKAAYDGPELIATHDRTAYIVYPVDIGNSRLTNAVLEKHLGTHGTARNWNTVLRIAANLA
ncbi:MAG: DUF1697 domain-containing protein [Candidatus Eremiobacteraeota bacterium]|nr:DUF1697 domain-containing protein [Candidatus Eremiobacteraeota bacterium]